MSKNESMFDQILKNDENVKRWKNQIIDAENLIKSMENDLEIERAKETLLLSEMRGKILQVEQLTSRASQQANERLQNLMVDQLVEVNKSEIMVKVSEENYRQCAISLKEISKWKPTMPEFLVTGSHRAHEKDPGTHLPDELKQSERELIEEDIMKIEEVIMESEKEHEVLKEFLSEHQKLLMEMESRATVEVEKPRERSSKKVEDEPLQSVTPKQHSQITKVDQRVELADDPVPSSSQPSISVIRPKIQNRAFEAKTAIISKKGGEPQCPVEYSRQGFSKENVTGLTNPTPKWNPPTKKTKLNLYDTSVPTQSTVTVQTKNLQTSASKSMTSFKPKTPSTLRNRIN